MKRPNNSLAFNTEEILIGGRWRPARGGTHDVYNPSTGEVICKIGKSTAEDVDDAVVAAREGL